jgi:hypothetical protein
MKCNLFTFLLLHAGPHIKMFREGGRYDLLEKKQAEINTLIDESGDGLIQLDEFTKLVEILALGWNEKETQAKFKELVSAGGTSSVYITY